MDEVPDCANVIFELLGKRRCLANKSRYSLTECSVEPLNSMRLATVLADGSVPFVQHSGFRGLPEVAVTNRALTGHRR